MLYNRKVYKLICITNMMEMTPDLAELCGIHAGDGYMRLREKGKGEVDISGSLEEKEYYDDFVIPLFNKVFDLNLCGKKFSRGTYGLICYDDEVRDILLNSGFPSGKKSKIVRVPKIILESENREICSAFLRGLFDTDGNLYFSRRRSGKYIDFKKKNNYYPVISFVTISSFLASEIVYLLRFVGFEKINLYEYQPKLSKRGYIEQTRYNVVLYGRKNLSLFFEKIGSKNPIKLSRYLVWKKFGYCPPCTTFQQRQDLLNGRIDINSLGS